MNNSTEFLNFLVNFKENPRKWWDYAIKSILLYKNKKKKYWNLSFLKKKKIKRNDYIRMCQFKLIYEAENQDNEKKKKSF